MATKFSLLVNGSAYSVETYPDTVLLAILRKQLDLERSASGGCGRSPDCWDCSGDRQCDLCGERNLPAVAANGAAAGFARISIGVRSWMG